MSGSGPGDGRDAGQSRMLCCMSQLRPSSTCPPGRRGQLPTPAPAATQLPLGRASICAPERAGEAGEALDRIPAGSASAAGRLGAHLPPGGVCGSPVWGVP